MPSFNPPCRWVWTGDEWAPHPNYPHNCLLGQSCIYPSSEGVYIGQEVDTSCM